MRWVRALALEQAGRAEEAAEAAAGALAAYQRAGFVSYIAWHAPDLVRIALAAGRPGDAERVVVAAKRAATMLSVASRQAGALRARVLLGDDAALLLDAVAATRQLLRQAGLRLGARDKHTPAGHGWQSLTRAEPRVTGLAGQGRSNPDIAQALHLSRRTVGWHLSNVYRKLGVSTRAQLAAGAAAGAEEETEPVAKAGVG